MSDLQPEDRVFRTRAILHGAHWHVRVYSAKREDLTFACLGSLTMDEHDYRRFVAIFPGQHIEETEDADG